MDFDTGMTFWAAKLGPDWGATSPNKNLNKMVVAVD